MKETVPPELWAWVTGSVKKSTGLAKRLVRLSEFWLGPDCKDWGSFQKKFKLLIVDYLERLVLGTGSDVSSSK